MKPYGGHSKACQCVMCGPDHKQKGKSPKKRARAKGKKGIQYEVYPKVPYKKDRKDYSK